MISVKNVSAGQKSSMAVEHTLTVAAGGFDAGALLGWHNEAHPCKTASWTWKEGHHEINISDVAFGGITKEDTVSSPTGYLKSLYRHERGHAHHTERDIKEVAKLAASVGVPFQVLNLFEDARIESLMRKKTKLRFRWLDYEKPAGTADPLQAMFCLIQSENGLAARTACRDTRYGPDFNNRSGGAVPWYYNKVIGCKSTRQVIGWASRFMKHFNIRPTDPVPKSSTDGDMQVALDTSTGMGASDDGGRSSGEAVKSPVEATGRGGARNVKCKTWPSGMTLGRYELTQRTLTDAALITRALKGLVVQGNSKMLAEYGKRVSVRSLATLKLGKLFVGRSDEEKALPKVLVVVDCSGSMQAKDDNGSSAENNAKAICAGFRDSKDLETEYIFTSQNFNVFKGKRDIDNRTLADLACNSGCEGFGPFFNRYPTALLGYAAVVVVTDANITDQAIDWKALQHKGVTNVVGVYAGKPDLADEAMRKHFARFIIAPTVAGVADRIKQLLKSVM